MPYTQYADLTIGTIDGVQTKVGSTELAVQVTKYDPSLDSIIQTALNDTKANTLANHLDNYFRDVMPSTIPRWVEIRTYHFRKWHRRFNLDTYPVMGMFQGGGGGWYYNGGQFVGVNAVTGGLTGRQHPETFWIDLQLGATPTNGNDNTCTLWGSARNGDRAIDVNNNVLYINRGSDTSNPPTVNWQVQNYQDMKNYLINPSILAQAHEYCAIARMFELGATRNTPNYAGQDKKSYMLDMQEHYHRKFVASLYGEFTEYGKPLIPGVLKLVQTDFSNLGQWGEFDKEMAGEEHWGIV